MMRVAKFKRWIIQKQLGTWCQKSRVQNREKITGKGSNSVVVAMMLLFWQILSNKWMNEMMIWIPDQERFVVCCWFYSLLNAMTASVLLPFPPLFMLSCFQLKLMYHRTVQPDSTYFHFLFLLAGYYYYIQSRIGGVGDEWKKKKWITCGTVNRETNGRGESGSLFEHDENTNRLNRIGLVSGCGLWVIIMALEKLLSGRKESSPSLFIIQSLIYNNDHDDDDGDDFHENRKGSRFFPSVPH